MYQTADNDQILQVPKKDGQNTRRN